MGLQEGLKREDLFAQLLQSTILSGTGPLSDEDVESLLVTYKLYCTAQFLVWKLKNILETNPDDQNIRDRVAKILSKWARVEHSKFIVKTLLETLPPLVSNDEMNVVKLSLITKSDAIPGKPILKTPEPQRNATVTYLHYNSDIFHGYKPIQVAQTLSIIDWSIFIQIKHRGILVKGWQGDDRHTVAPALSQLAERFDKMSFWVSSQILLMRPLDKQAKLVTFLIKVMKHLVDMRNHQSAQQILSGLNMASVQRLKRLWALIPFKRREIFDEIDELFSPIGNHAKYREVLARMETEANPCIPYIAMYLRDIVYVIDGNPEFTPEGEINFVRSKLLAQQVLRLLRFQHNPFTFDVPDPLVNYLQELKGPILSEEELWELSLGHQPLAENMSDVSDFNNYSAASEIEFSDEESGLDFEDQESNNPEAVTLSDVINEPLLCNGFRKFLARDNCAEHLYFIRDLNRFVNLPEADSRARKARAREISQMYLRPDSQLLVNVLTATEREDVCTQIDKSQTIPSGIFQPFQEASSKVLQGKLPGYLSDSLYKSCKIAMHCIMTENTMDPFEDNAGLTDRDWAVLFQDATELTLPAETVLIQQDAHNSRLYRLKSGTLRIEKVGPDGVKKVVGKIDKPVLIGEMSIFNVNKATASVIVHGSAEVYCLEVIQFRNKLFPEPQLGLRFYRHTGKQLADILTKVSSIKRDKNRRSVKRMEPNNSPNSPSHSLEHSRDESESRDGSASSFSDAISRLQLDSNEEIIACYHCKCLTGVVNRQVELYLTNNNVYSESKIFGQRSKDIIPVSKIINVSIAEKSTLVITTKTKKRKFVLKPDDLAKCNKNIEQMITNQSNSSVKLSSFIRTNSSSEVTSMELSAEEWDVILSDSNYASLRFAKDDVIMQQGLKYNMLCQISSGSVRVEKQHSDCSVHLAVLGQGEIFGEITFVSGGCASATVIVNEDVELFVIHQRSLDKLFASSHQRIVLKFYHFLCSVLAKRIVEQEKLLFNQRTTKRKKDSLSVKNSQ